MLGSRGLQQKHSDPTTLEAPDNPARSFAVPATLQQYGKHEVPIFHFCGLHKKISQVGQNLQRTCTFVRLGGSILRRLSITRLSHRFYQRSVCLSLFWHGASLAPTRSI